MQCLIHFVCSICFNHIWTIKFSKNNNFRFYLLLRVVKLALLLKLHEMLSFIANMLMSYIKRSYEGLGKMAQKYSRLLVWAGIRTHDLFKCRNITQRCNKTSCCIVAWYGQTFCFKLNFLLPKNESVFNILGYFLEQFQIFSRGSRKSVKLFINVP